MIQNSLGECNLYNYKKQLNDSTSFNYSAFIDTLKWKAKLRITFYLCSIIEYNFERISEGVNIFELIKTNDSSERTIIFAISEETL